MLTIQAIGLERKLKANKILSLTYFVFLYIQILVISNYFCLKHLESQSKFSGPRKFTLSY